MITVDSRLWSRGEGRTKTKGEIEKCHWIALQYGFSSPLNEETEEGW